MPKATSRDPSTATSSKRDRRKLRRLERSLAKARAEETRRADRLEQARSSGASRKVEQRRARKVERAHAKGEELEAAIAKLRPKSVEPVFAYCLRDRERVAMEDPQPTTMKNGRSALAGRCPKCGQRLVRPVATPRATAASS